MKVLALSISVILFSGCATVGVNGTNLNEAINGLEEGFISAKDIHGSTCAEQARNVPVGHRADVLERCMDEQGDVLERYYAKQAREAYALSQAAYGLTSSASSSAAAQNSATNANLAPAVGFVGGVILPATAGYANVQAGRFMDRQGDYANTTTTVRYPDGGPVDQRIINAQEQGQDQDTGDLINQQNQQAFGGESFAEGGKSSSKAYSGSYSASKAGAKANSSARNRNQSPNIKKKCTAGIGGCVQ